MYTTRVAVVSRAQSPAARLYPLSWRGRGLSGSSGARHPTVPVHATMHATEDGLNVEGGSESRVDRAVMLAVPETSAADVSREHVP